MLLLPDMMQSAVLLMRVTNVPQGVYSGGKPQGLGTRPIALFWQKGIITNECPSDRALLLMPAAFADALLHRFIACLCTAATAVWGDSRGNF